MADEVLTDKDDEEIVIIETPAEAGGIVPVDGDKPLAADDTDDDDDIEDDERLGANEADTEEGLSPEKIKRKRRRERERRAREAKDAEIAELRAFKNIAETRFAALEGNALGLSHATLEARIQQARSTVATAEHVRQQAEAAGNTSDVIEAIKHRDAAYAEIARLEPALNDINRARTAPPQTPKTPQNNQLLTYAAEWKAANAKWYDDNSTDDNSVAARQIAAKLHQEGLSGDTRLFWRTLSKRLSDIIAPPKPATPAGRRTPPTGQRGEGAAPNGRPREVYLSAERIQAIKDAGKWDDPAERNHMVKAYLDYDRQNTANQTRVG